MELGWILILAGIAILAFLHFSGRSRGNRSMGQAASQSTLQEDTLLQSSSDTGPNADPYAAPMTNAANAANAAAEDYSSAHQGVPHNVQPASQSRQPGVAPAVHPGVHHDHLNPSDGYDPHTAGYPADYINDPLMSPQDLSHGENPLNHGAQAQQPVRGSNNDSFDMEPDDMQRPADAHQSGYPNQSPANQVAMNDALQTQPPANAEISATRQASGFSSFLANLSGGILGKRRVDEAGGFDPLAADGGMHPSNGAEPMVITLHVVAPEGQIIHGPRLQSLFEQRGYHYGEMNIFHSLNQGNIVFSVAKIVEPGTFDINNPASFETPGITLILQLPAPVAANVAFDVLVSEASEMARALGCNLLDSGHSTLSRQTIQHLSDSVQQFMHRQRVAESVPS